MSSVTGLELPNSWRTSLPQDGSFDISADQLNNTVNRELWIPSGAIDWQAAIMKNVLDPVDDQDVATKIYVDTNGGNLWYTFPAGGNVDYVSAYKNINMIDPTADQDSATKKYVDDNVGSQTLDGLTDVTITTPAPADILQYNGSQWVNQVLVVPAGSAISQGNSSVSVIDSGVGRVETVVDGVLKLNIEQAQATLTTPLIMSSQQIKELGTPSVDTDAATKKYADDLFATAPTDLDGLTDVTITSPQVNQFLVNNGSGQWINQDATRTQLPSEIAYEDEANVFNELNVFLAGLQVAVDKPLDMSGGFILDTKYQDYAQQASDPADPAIDDVRIFYGASPTFGSDQPQLEALIERGGVIVKKPIPASETIFALNSFSNGMMTLETGTRLSDNNPTIRLQVFNEAVPADPYSCVLEGSIFTIASPDTTINTSNTIDLTEGTDITPVKHWVWLALSGGIPVLQSNTVSFPTSGDFVVIGTFLFQTRTSVIADGAYAVNSPDYEIKDSDVRGHLAHLNDNLLFKDAQYISGIALTTAPVVGGGTAGNVTFTSTAGEAMELHREDIESYDITTGIALVENEGTQTPEQVTRVNDIGLDMVGLTCANGSTVIGNNDRINVVIYTVHNDDEPNQTNYGINVPFDVYGNDTDAIADVDGYAIKNVPLNVRGITLLVAEVVIAISGGAGSFEVLAVKDLRGQIPGAAGGSGGGGGGVTQLNDLSDVTINTPLINQNLVNDGAGQWVNIDAPQLTIPNSWTNYQDYTEVTPTTAPVSTIGRFSVERIDVNNTALFIWLEVAGVMTKLRLAN